MVDCEKSGGLKFEDEPYFDFIIVDDCEEDGMISNGEEESDLVTDEMKEGFFLPFNDYSEDEHCSDEEEEMIQEENEKALITISSLKSSVPESTEIILSPANNSPSSNEKVDTLFSTTDNTSATVSTSNQKIFSFICPTSIMAARRSQITKIESPITPVSSLSLLDNRDNYNLKENNYHHSNDMHHINSNCTDNLYGKEGDDLYNYFPGFTQEERINADQRDNILSSLVSLGHNNHRLEGIEKVDGRKRDINMRISTSSVLKSSRGTTIEDVGDDDEQEYRYTKISRKAAGKSFPRKVTVEEIDDDEGEGECECEKNYHPNNCHFRDSQNKESKGKTSTHFTFYSPPTETSTESLKSRNKNSKSTGSQEYPNIEDIRDEQEKPFTALKSRIMKWSDFESLQSYPKMTKKSVKKITKWLTHKLKGNEARVENRLNENGNNRQGDDVKRRDGKRGRIGESCRMFWKRVRNVAKRSRKIDEGNNDTHKDDERERVGSDDSAENTIPSLPIELNTLLKCLSKHEKHNLEYGGIDLGECKTRRAAFQYADFLSEISMQGLYTAAKAWFEKTQDTENISKIKNGQSLICRALCRLFMTHNGFIHSLALDFSDTLKFKSYPYFPYHPNAPKFLSNLRDLSISCVSSRDLFTDIGSYCRNLKKLEIVGYTFDNLPEKRHDSAGELIKSQVGLRYCKIFGYGSRIVKPIMGLSNQAKTLKFLELTYCKFYDLQVNEGDDVHNPNNEKGYESMDAFENEQTCQLVSLLAKNDNLVSLKLAGSCGNHREFKDFLPQLAKLLPLKMKRLSLCLNWIIFDTLDKFLKNCEADLESLYISGWKRRIPEKHINTIKEYLEKRRRKTGLYEFVRDIV
ncbi:6480_t:CDS:2 [Acaulospora colombiana]|uniref:6480_t:CDS:1 n=1 Tax=Acaulospora colombiana TaxID=27376 RepID=A0ACA9MFY5_9GLOM|nr:6480_t:CDS:2 [Acaulospora colombiana]